MILIIHGIIKLNIQIKKNNNDISKISKVKYPWLLDNEFNEDGFNVFLNWFRNSSDGIKIYSSLRDMINTVEDKLIKFDLNYIEEEINNNFHLYQLDNLEYNFTLNKFIYHQKNFSNILSKNNNNELKKNLHHKILDEKWWEIHSENYNDKISCITCCPNKNYLCTFNIPYNSFFILSVLFGFLLQMNDIISDIYVLIDLYFKELYYFYCCLSIMILTSVVNSVLSIILSSNKKTKPGQKLYQIRNNSDLSKKILKKSF